MCALRPGRTDVLQHRIYLTQQVPIKQRPYRMSPTKQALVEKQLEEMLSAGIVKPSHSGWASPVVLVPQKRWEPPKTAFITPFGLFQFNVMPFGLKNAPATFQRLMEMVLGELHGHNCFVYIDDIIIYSPTIEQHFLDIQSVLHKLQIAGLTINLKKSKFCHGLFQPWVVFFRGGGV